ncbi:unnamed protein product [marine sediment metagenome]|uniref:Uncharacterized protein n=1 Tax=marine sediment metagenome TaxID=412755 RepID=X0VJN0_9ZZZZ
MAPEAGDLSYQVDRMIELCAVLEISHLSHRSHSFGAVLSRDFGLVAIETDLFLGD